MSKTFITMIRDGSDPSIIYAGANGHIALLKRPEGLDPTEDFVVLVWEYGKEIGKYINGKYIDYSLVD